MVKHHSSLVCFFCLIWICLSWQRPTKVPRFKSNNKAESVKIETIKDPKAVKEFLVNPKKDSEEFRPVPLPENFSRYDNNINDNFITLKELIKTTGARRNAKEAFKDADKNGDGKISPEEFQGAPWTLNVSEILVNTNISNTDLTEILEEESKQNENRPLKTENALASKEMENKMNSFDIGMENSTDIKLEDSSESRLDDSSESQMENSFESQMEDSFESQLEDNFERIMEGNSESQMEDSFESQLEDNFGRILDESSENQMEDSFESQLKNNFENLLEDNFESRLDDSSESQVKDSSERKSDDTSESILGDGLENRLESIFEDRLIDSSDIKDRDNSDLSVEDNSERFLEDSSKNSVKVSSENSVEETPKSREIVKLNSDRQSWNSHHS